MKTYILQRDQDESGVSGTGPVGEVVEFPNGQAVLQWSEHTLAGVQSISIFPSLADLEKIHGHDGATRLVPTGQAGNGQAPSATAYQEDENGNAILMAESEEVLEFAEAELEETFTEGTFAFGEHSIPYLDVPARLFQAGVHRGKPWTNADLEELASTFRAPQTVLSDWDVPVQLDHSDSARDTQGHLRSAYVKGDDLMGVLRFVGEQACQPVREGRYRKLSVGVRLTKPKRLKEVSVTPFPQVPTAAIKFSQQEDESMKTGTEAEKPKTEEKPVEKPEEKMTEAKPAPAPSTEKTAPAPAVAEMSEAAKAEMARIEAEFRERTSALEARFAEREAKLKEQEQIARFKELAAKVDRFCDEGVGKSVPAMREKELALLKTFSEEQLSLYEELKELQPAVIQYGVMSVQTSFKNSDDELDNYMEARLAKTGAEKKQ